MTETLTNIAQQFSLPDSIESVRPFGTGNINTTFLVSQASPSTTQFILQSINRHVFQQPELIMKNMSLVCRHINEKACLTAWDSEREWLMPKILCTAEGTDHYVDEQGKFWRAMSFIDSARTYDSISTPKHAREVGWALGTFHSLVNDLPAEILADTLPGFHITPTYLADFHKALEKYQQAASPEIRFCKRFIEQHTDMAHILEEAKYANKLSERPIHGDPKVSNVMIDKKSGFAISIIDLDTVKPGLVHYDIGDCLRSGCNPLGEDSDSLEQTHFDIDLCREILEGYLSQARQFFTQHDFNYLYDSARIIAFELGLRYFTDFLNGNIYFKVHSPDQNLHRAMVQFTLTKSIESQNKEIKSLIASLT